MTIYTPEYLTALKNAHPYDALMVPSQAARILRLRHRQFFMALNAGLIPSYMVAGRRLVCLNEVLSLLQLLREVYND